jgi:anti-anti-sigma regulatory factor
MSATQGIQWSGTASIRNVAKYHDDLRDALSVGADVALDLSHIDEVDLAFIQLIIAARRSAETRGLSLTLSSPAPEPMLQTLERGGFIGTAPDDRRHFWLAQ